MKPELAKFGAPYAFRYRSNNGHTIDEIENNYIYFANRDQLNDPFDSSPAYISMSESKNELELLRAEMLKLNDEVVLKNYLDGSKGLENILKVTLE